MNPRHPAMALLRAAGLAIGLGLGAAGSASATTIVLYDGALGGLPSDQGMVFGGLVAPTAGGGVTNLDTTAGNFLQAGFGALSPVALDDTVGYSLQFSAEIVAESHSGSAVRAGFSVIVTSAAPSRSIEIGFQDGRVFAQNDAPLFGDPPADVNATFSPVGAGLIDFELAVLGGSYTLLADGVSVLAGSLRDYTASPFPVYGVANGVFLGDDTSSAQANVNLARVALVIPSPVPEPATLATFALGLLGVSVMRRKRARPRQARLGRALCGPCPVQIRPPGFA